MQLTNVPSRRVVWEDGMHLTPQHFQAQRRYQEDQTARTLGLLFPFAYGVSALSLDTELLKNGMLGIVSLRGVLPDGTVVHTPGADVIPRPITLSARFSPTRDMHIVHLAIPHLRNDDANVQEPAALAEQQVPSARYQAVTENVVDEATGGDATSVRFAARNLYLLLDEEVNDGLASMPIARVRRDGTGQFQLDTDYIPPTLQLGASARLTDLTRRLIVMLEAKGGSLAASLQNAPSGAAGGAAAYVGNELATRWLLHAVRSSDGPLRHLLLTRHAHPERLFLELSKLAGALCTFSISAKLPALPAYDHDDLTRSFEEIEKHIRTQLDIVVSARAIIIPLHRTTDVLHAAPVTESRCYEPGARWFLGVSANLSRADLVDRVQRLTKTCASVYVLELVNRAWNGLPTEHIPSPPATIAPKPDLQYFELIMTGGCATSLAKTQEIGVYIPDALPGAYVEVAVLVPE